MSVIFTPKVQEYLDDLIPILYEKMYFGFEEAALNYVYELIDEIIATLPTRLHRPASSYFNQFGKDMYYATFRKNRQTVWYAFFTRYDVDGQTVYLVRHIANNHTVAQHL